MAAARPSAGVGAASPPLLRARRSAPAVPEPSRVPPLVPPRPARRGPDARCEPLGVAGEPWDGSEEAALVLAGLTEGVLASGVEAPAVADPLSAGDEGSAVPVGEEPAAPEEPEEFVCERPCVPDASLADPVRPADVEWLETSLCAPCAPVVAPVDPLEDPSWLPLAAPPSLCAPRSPSADVGRSAPDPCGSPPEAAGSAEPSAALEAPVAVEPSGEAESPGAPEPVEASLVAREGEGSPAPLAEVPEPPPEPAPELAAAALAPLPGASSCAPETLGRSSAKLALEPRHAASRASARVRRATHARLRSVVPSPGSRRSGPRRTWGRSGRPRRARRSQRS